MKYRRFGRTNWQVSEIGYGMWGMGGWKESDDLESERSLDLAVENGINFFDTACGTLTIPTEQPNKATPGATILGMD